MKTLITLCIAFSAVTAKAATSYKYTDLIIKDYDEMNNMVQTRIKKSKAVGTKDRDGEGNDGEAIELLRDALKLTFSRPNSDNMIAKLTPEIRRELLGYNAFEDTISSLAAEAISISKDKNATVSQQSTALFVLENLLGEIRPEAQSNTDLRRVVERISDANLKISDEVMKDRKIRSMFKTDNPSHIAADILKGIAKEKDKKK